MRLASLRNAHASDPLFLFAQNLTITLLDILVKATNQDKVIWVDRGLNMFSTVFFGLDLMLDFQNNEPPMLHVGLYHIEDNGSGSYGFDELDKAIQSQVQRLKPKDLKPGSPKPKRR